MATSSTNPNFAGIDFHPILSELENPEKLKVIDFNNIRDSVKDLRESKSTLSSDFLCLKGSVAVGRYNESRPSLYNQKIFARGGRHIHIGIDFGVPEGTQVFNFWDGEIIKIGHRKIEGDYGPVLILRHLILGTELFSLFGHLSSDSLLKKIGQKIKKSEPVGRVGAESENGGWPPHVHFQLSWRRPQYADMPGVASEKELNEILLIHPDPRIILGNIY